MLPTTNSRPVLHLLDAAHWARLTLDFCPDPQQSDILSSPARRLILCCSRQWGKSTITALKAVHHALFHPNSLVITAAPTLRQSGEWLRKVAQFLLRLGIPFHGDGLNPSSLVLPNASRLVALPGDASTTRGFSAVSLLIFDEAAFVPDTLFHALSPMLATTQGALWLLSTPNSESGFFFETWYAQPAHWHRYTIPASACPRIPHDFLEEQRQALGDQAFRREYNCEFLGAGLPLFPRDLIQSAYDPTVEPFNNGKPWFRE